MQPQQKLASSVRFARFAAALLVTALLVVSSPVVKAQHEDLELDNLIDMQEGHFSAQ